MTHLCPHTGEVTGDTLPKFLRDEVADEIRIHKLAWAARDGGVCVHDFAVSTHAEHAPDLNERIRDARRKALAWEGV